VARKDFARNALVVVQGRDDPLLYRHDIEVTEMHWIAGISQALPARFAAKTRYRMSDARCEVRADGDALRVHFDVPQWAPTPGQYLVLYDEDVCLGGGVIVDHERARTPSAFAEATG
jgi:tRNA-specific 2-thiouridylase